MVIPNILIAISVLIWLIIPFRQFKGSYFVFFLILALADPVTLILVWIFPIHPFRIYVVIFLFVIYSILEPDKLKRRIHVVIIITLADIAVAVFANITYLRLVLFLLDLPILYIFLGKTVNDINKNYKISSFYLVLNFYILTLLAKNFIYLIDIKTGIYYFYITSALEILISLFFVFYNDKNAFRYYLKT